MPKAPSSYNNTATTNPSAATGLKLTPMPIQIEENKRKKGFKDDPVPFCLPLPPNRTVQEPTTEPTLLEPQVSKSGDASIKEEKEISGSPEPAKKAVSRSRKSVRGNTLDRLANYIPSSTDDEKDDAPLLWASPAGPARKSVRENALNRLANYIASSTDNEIQDAPRLWASPAEPALQSTQGTKRKAADSIVDATALSESTIAPKKPRIIFRVNPPPQTTDSTVDAISGPKKPKITLRVNPPTTDTTLDTATVATSTALSRQIIINLKLGPRPLAPPQKSSLPSVQQPKSKQPKLKQPKKTNATQEVRNIRSYAPSPSPNLPAVSNGREKARVIRSGAPSPPPRPASLNISWEDETAALLIAPSPSLAPAPSPAPHPSGYNLRNRKTKASAPSPPLPVCDTTASPSMERTDTTSTQTTTATSTSTHSQSADTHIACTLLVRENLPTEDVGMQRCAEWAAIMAAENGDVSEEQLQQYGRSVADFWAAKLVTEESAADTTMYEATGQNWL